MTIFAREHVFEKIDTVLYNTSLLRVFVVDSLTNLHVKSHPNRSSCKDFSFFVIYISYKYRSSDNDNHPNLNTRSVSLNLSTDFLERSKREVVLERWFLNSHFVCCQAWMIVLYSPECSVCHKCFKVLWQVFICFTFSSDWILLPKPSL